MTHLAFMNELTLVEKGKF